MTNKDKFIRNLFSMTAPYVDSLSTAFSFGLCHLWRRKLVSLAGIRGNDKVLDVCAGTGEVSVLLVGKVGQEGSVTCVDFCEDMLDVARKKIGCKPNVSFVVNNAKQLEFLDNSFDAVTVAFGMRNIPDTCAALCEIKRVLKPGGRFFTLELTRPTKRWFQPFYRWYVFKVIPFVGRIITKTSVPYSYLPVSIDTYHSPAEYKDMIRECGFADVRDYSLSLGIATIFGAVK